ncbi:MAG: Panacea domain-containing protein [Candidatus Dormiibacterota bacterium]
MDWQKFKELVLYISRRSEADPRFGAVKLNKILYYADFAAHRRLGHAITEATYQHLDEGPAPREMLVAQREMMAAGDLIIESRPYYNRTQRRAKALRDPRAGILSAAELEIVNEVIEDLFLLDAQQVADRSHQEFGYRATGPREDIPYRTAWIGSAPLTAEQIEVGFEVARRNGLLAGAA